MGERIDTLDVDTALIEIGNMVYTHQNCGMMHDTVVYQHNGNGLTGRSVPRWETVYHTDSH